MPEPKLTLHRKLAQVMYEAERIPKRGKAPAVMGGYEFVQVGDAADFIRKQLAEKVLTMMPTKIEVVGMQDRPTKSGGTMTTLDLRVEWTITDGESGETITIESFGAGADGGDKYSGKAMTNAMKYALLAGFLLSTGDDPELGHDEAGRAKREQAPGPLTREPVQSKEPKLLGEATYTGSILVRKTGASDGMLRQGPDGVYFIVAFRTVDQNIVPQVLVKGALATDIYDAAAGVLNGLDATISGDLYEVPFSNGDFNRPFQRLELKHIQTQAWTLPVPTQTGPGLFDAEGDTELDAVIDSLAPDMVHGR